MSAPDEPGTPAGEAPPAPADAAAPPAGTARPDRGVLLPDPVWRQDFPLTSAGEDEVTRREFVRYLVLASGGFAAGNVGIALWSSLRSINEGEPRELVALDRVPEGSAYLFDYPTGADPAILVHLPGGELRAFSQKCTHLGCVVYYEPKTGELECPCHEGHFDAATGDVLAGPPQRRLGRIDVEVREGMVWALAARGEQGEEETSP